MRQRRLPQNKPCDANPEVASGSAWPNVGLTAAFAALRPGGFPFARRALLCHWAGHLHARPSYCGMVFELRSEPWKGLQADSEG